MARGLIAGLIVAAVATGVLTYLSPISFDEPKGEVSDQAASSPSSSSVAIVTHRPSQGQASLGGPFSLRDHTGKTRTDAEFKGRHMIVYFGYSFCPDICPAALYNLTQALQALSPKELKKLAPLFITIDPERDTVENLKTYMENFHPSILALTGSQMDLDPVLKAYRVYAKKTTPEGTAAEYLMDHSSIVYVMDHLGRFVTSFNHQTDPESILKILRGVISAT